MTCRVHLMSGQREVLPDQSMKETPACDAHREAAHLVFAPAGRLVAVLGTVVHACGRFDENVLHMSELGNVSLRRRIAAQLVGNDFARHRV
ncbi:MAG: hypothetical protein JWQ50_9422 [Caballeronia mineralivorans]|nr:hypothetical protein [Caballeronia mineralivorans]